MQLRYSIYWQQIQLASTMDDCNNINPDFMTSFPTQTAIVSAAMAGLAYPGYSAAVAAGNQTNCLLAGANLGQALIGQASLPVRVELAQGGYLTSLAGYGFTYNTLDNNKHPTNGILVSFGQDVAGLGGDAFYIRTTADFRSYYEIVSDLIGMLHLQGGDMIGLSRLPDQRRMRFQ